MKNADELQNLTKAELIEAYNQVNNSLERVFSITSHDLRSPFSGLLGLSEMLASGSESISPEALQEYHSAMRDSLKNTFQLLENLFEWGQIERGKYNKTIESIPLKIAIDEVLESLGTQVQDKEIEVVHKYDPEQIIESNSKMFEFVMKNFILNAVKFSERGSRVEITCHAEKSRAAVSVKDYGIGISEENINKLFSTNVNWRIHGTEGENGTGLGLLASSRYADYFGAELSVESTPGIGSTFTIILSADLS